MIPHEHSLEFIRFEENQMTQDSKKLLRDELKALLKFKKEL